MRTPAALFVVTLWLVLPEQSQNRAVAREKAAVVKWEYGLLTIAPGRGGGNPGGNPAGRYTWMAGTEDVAADGWKELAEKLKVDLKDKEAPPAKLRVLVLNHLGTQGWEMVSESGFGTPIHTYTFKRRVP